MQKHLCWTLSNLFSVIAYLKILLMTSMLRKNLKKQNCFCSMTLDDPKTWSHIIKYCFCLKPKLQNHLPQRTFTVKILWSQLIWLYLQQARVQSSTEALTMQVMTARWRWWLVGGKLWVSPWIFSTRAKKSASLSKMLWKISILWLKACNFHFYKNF